VNLAKELAIAGTEARLMVIVGYDSTVVDAMTQQALTQRDMPVAVRVRLAVSVIRSHIRNHDEPTPTVLAYSRLFGDTVVEFGRQGTDIWMRETPCPSGSATTE